MIERFVTLEDAIKSTVAVIDKNLPVLNSEQWLILKELYKVLRPLEDATRDISAENYVTGSLVIPLITGLLSVYNNLKLKPFNSHIQTVISKVLTNMNEIFANVEKSKTFPVCTLLDPRFKRFVTTAHTSKITQRQLQSTENAANSEMCR